MKTRVGSESDLQGRLNAAVDGELGASDAERARARNEAGYFSQAQLSAARRDARGNPAHAPRESAPAGIVKLIAGIGAGGGASFSSVVPRRAMVAGAVVVAIVIFMVAFGSFSPGR